MLKALACSFLILSFFFLSISAADVDNDNDNENDRCNCEVDGFWSLDFIFECQRVGDFLIAIAYFSIPIELLYFVTSSNLPFKWVLFEFIAFIVLCGMTHLLNAWSYRPHNFQLAKALTVFKILTALVSFVTAISLFSLIPTLLKVKVREYMLRQKTSDLNREVGLIKKQTEAGSHVRMLTQEIRKSLDRHTILYTTLVELSNVLNLQNCAVWMPNIDRTELYLTHELNGMNENSSSVGPIPRSNADVREIKGDEKAKILEPDSALAVASSGGTYEPGSAVGIRIPILRVSNFKGGTPEMVPACYAILVLVFPDGSRTWSNQELEMVEVVADQVAVALSHASILEESQLMSEKLVEQNRVLEKAKEDALMASRARENFQMVMSNGLRRPMHSIVGLLSVLCDENNLSDEQRLVINTMVKSSDVLSTLITDVMDTSSTSGKVRFPLEIKSFKLRSVIKEAACLSKCLCASRGYDFAIEVDSNLPNHVVGDERRVFQVILHMVGNLLNGSRGGGCLSLRLFSDNENVGWNEQRWAQWRSDSSEGEYFYVRLEVGIRHTVAVIPYGGQRYYNSAVEEGMSFNACRKLVQLMQGDIWIVSNSDGSDQGMALVIRFQISSDTSEHEESSSLFSDNNSIFRDLKVLLVDSDDVNRDVTRKLLEKLGCTVSSVSSAYECLSTLGPATSSYKIVLLDLHLFDMDGFEVASRIRKFRSRSWPLIVAMSASDDGDTRDRCVQIGMSGFIQKPGSVRDIGNELRRILVGKNKNLA